MTSDETGLRVAGAWLAAASLLLALALGFHGPLHPDLEVQMTHIGESASRWAAVHWTAASAFSCFAVAAVLVLVSRSRMTSTGTTISAWAVVLVGALWTLTTAVTEVTVIADLATSRDLARFETWWSFAEGHGDGFSMLAVAVAAIAWREVHGSTSAPSEVVGRDRYRSRIRVIRRLALGVWLDVGPATSCGSLRRG